MPQSRKKPVQKQRDILTGTEIELTVDHAKKGEDTTVVPGQFVPLVTIPKPAELDADILLARNYPNVGDSIPGLLKAILKELLLMRHK